MTSSRSARHPVLILIALALAQLMIGLDYNIIFVALPDIGSGVHFSPQQLQWVVSAYAVPFGGFLLLGGRLSDLLGRRRVFLVGLALYAIASVGGALAHNPGELVAARALQGLGGAFLAPSTLSLITTTFAEGRERNRALGVWGATGSSGMVLGSLLGGVLTQAFGWSAIFWVNVPLAVGVGLLALNVVPADGAAQRRRGLDVPGGITVTIGATALVFALVQGPDSGWLAPVTLASFGLAVVMIAAFLVIESRSASPLVPLRVFTHRSLTLGALVTFMFMATFGASAYFITLSLQRVHGWDALSTGLAFVLPCACVLIGTVIGGRLSTALGVRSTLVLGLAVGAVGTAVFAAFLGTGSTYLQMTPGIVVFSVAQGVVFTAMYSAATDGLPSDLQGLASGVATSGQQVGAAMGLAVMMVVISAVSGTNPAPSRLAGGLQTATYTSAVLILLSVGLALGMRRRRPVAPVIEPEPAVDAGTTL